MKGECYGITQSVIRPDVFITNTLFCFMQKIRCIYIFKLSQHWPKMKCYASVDATMRKLFIMNECELLSLIIPVCMDKISRASRCYARYARAELSSHQSTLWNSLIDRYYEGVGFVSYIHQSLIFDEICQNYIVSHTVHYS